MDEYNGGEPLVFQGRGWTKFPAFFVDDLMPVATGIPASFWKYLFVVWRDCFDQRPGYRCSKTMAQFHVTEKNARKWTAALCVSYLFDVRLGKRHLPNVPGIPTQIIYRPQSSKEDWLCFIAALRETILADKREHHSDLEGFRVQVAINVRAERRRNGLETTVLDGYLNRLPEGWVKKVEDGYEVNPQRRGESDRSRLNAEDEAYQVGE